MNTVSTNPAELKETLKLLNYVFDMHMSNRITLKEIVLIHLEREIEMLEKKIAFYSNN
jgi:hypothetical protein